MNTYFGIFLIAIITSLVATPLVRRLCERFQLLDVPGDGRRLHQRAIPRLGGVAIYVSVIASLAALPLVDNLLTQSLRARTSDVIVVAIPATLVLLLGIFDDLRGANATIKVTGLGLITTIFWEL